MMTNDLISRSDLINAKPEFMNEKVVRDTKYQTTKDRIYAKAWNACNSYWVDAIDNAPTVDAIPNEEGYEMYNKGYMSGYERGKEERPQGKWIEHYCPYVNASGQNCGNCTEPCHWFECSECGNKSDVSDYCPNCGADMRGRENEDSN